MEKTDISLYHYFTINERYFKNESMFHLDYETIYTCNELFRKQYIQLSTLFIPLCIDSYDRYCLYIEDHYTLISFVYWVFKISYGIKQNIK